MPDLQGTTTMTTCCLSALRVAVIVRIHCGTSLPVPRDVWMPALERTIIVDRWGISCSVRDTMLRAGVKRALGWWIK